MAFEIVWEHPDGALKRFFGHVTGMEVFRATQVVEADQRFDRLRYVINDFTDCTEFVALPSEVMQIVAIDRGASLNNRAIRIAVVATHPDVVAASIAYANSPFNAYVTRIVDSIETARSWLGERYSHSM